MTYLVGHLHRTESTEATSPLIVHRYAILTPVQGGYTYNVNIRLVAADSVPAIHSPASPTASAQGSRRASACSSPPAAPLGEHQLVFGEVLFL